MRKKVVLGLSAVAVAAGMGTFVSTLPAMGIPGPPAQPAMFATLDGAAEVGSHGRRGAGDPDGWGGAVVTVKATQELCFGMTVNLITTPVAAHIHEGRPSENGPVVVTLTPPSTGDPGASSGCTSIDSELANRIRQHPHGFYVNVHTADFPGGAARGQLFHPTER